LIVNHLVKNIAFSVTTLLFSATSLASNLTVKTISFAGASLKTPTFQESVPLKAGQGCVLMKTNFNLQSHSKVGSATYIQAAANGGFYIASVGSTGTKSNQQGILVTNKGVTNPKLPPAKINNNCNYNTVYVNTDSQDGIDLISIGAIGGLTFIHAE
jgi:hypothetical protein